MINIFVFGSNLQGRHGKGAAREAQRYHGAIYGRGEGLQGTSYAIPTKKTPYIPLELEEILKHVDNFISFANKRPECIFNLTRIGCGLAGYTDEQIAPMFKNLPENVKIPKKWESILNG